MRTFQKCTLVLVTFLLMNASLMANNNSGDPLAKTNEEIRKEIIQLIDTPDLKEGEEARVAFLITQSNKIVVLNVETDNLYLEDYIKNNMNYQSIETDGAQIHTPYYINLVFRQ